MSNLTDYYKNEIKEVKSEIVWLNTLLGEKENKLNELNILLRHKEGNSSSKQLKGIPAKEIRDK